MPLLILDVSSMRAKRSLLGEGASWPCRYLTTRGSRYFPVCTEMRLLAETVTYKVYLLPVVVLGDGQRPVIQEEGHA
jgi:hypothetical protein